MKKADLHLFWIATIRDFSHEIPTLLAKNSRYLSDSEGPAFAPTLQIQREPSPSSTTRPEPILTVILRRRCRSMLFRLAHDFLGIDDTCGLHVTWLKRFK